MINIKLVIAIIGSLLPIIAVTALGFYINFKELFPLVFPVSTIIFLVAFSQIFTSKKILLNIINLSVITLFGIYFYPKIASQLDFNKEKTPLKNYVFYEFLQKDSILTHINHKENSVIDFMFINCKPCRDKLNYLDELGKYTNVYVIVDGDVDSFEYYKTFYFKNKSQMKNLMFIYDIEGRFTKQFSLKVYPTEVIIKNNFIIARDQGFPKHAKREYLDLRKALLK